MSAKHQSLQEWHAAGGGVPVRFKGKEHIWQQQVQHLAGGGDPRKRAMYPKMPTQAIIESEGFDPDVPSDLSRAYARRMADKAEYERNIKDQKLTPTQRGVAGLEAAGMLGSAMFEGVQQLPKLLDSQEAYESAVGKGMYQPRFQPEKATEYVGNTSDFLEQLETKYKMPQVLPELLGMAPLADAAKRQAGKAVKQGALTAASRMDAGPKSGSMAAQRGAVKLGGGNWVDSETNRVIGKLKADESYPQSYIDSLKEDLAQYDNNPNLPPDAIAEIEQRKRDLAHMEQTNAYNKWLDTKVGGYVRNQMATPDDPVVKMLDMRAAKIEADYATGQKRLAKLDERIAQAEATASTTEERNNLANMKRTRAQRAAEVESDRELAMSALLPEGKDYAGYDYLKNNAADLINQREKAGFPIAGYAQSEPAKAWEAAQDMNVVVRPAEIFQNQEEKLAAVRAADKELNHYLNVELPDKFREHITQKDLPDAEKQDLIDKMPKNLMAHMIGDKEKRDLLNQAYYQARDKADASAFAMAEDNPYLAKLAPDTPVYNTLGYLPDLGIDHIIDVLKDDVATGKLKLEDLNKITMDQAVKRAGEYDFEMAKKARDAAATARESMPVHKEYPEGYKWVQLTKPGEFNAESNAMGHSVRGYEPERGHPDWTPESGDSGRSSYGHGGWEAIKSGKAKVYSLVDPSGKPHTTVEVRAKDHPISTTRRGDDFPEPTGFEYGSIYSGASPYKPTKDQLEKIHTKAYDLWRTKGTGRADDVAKFYNQAADEILGPMPEEITQIKGKGNARPQEKYDKYTQDFVRSGNWADVNRSDLRNTGLIQHSGKYFTEPEFVEAAKKYGRMGVQDVPWEVARQRHIDAGVPEEEALLNWVEGLKEGRGRLDIPEEGMKAGGRVNRKHFHEPHLSVGGDLAKIAAKSAKAAKPAVKVAEEAVKEMSMAEKIAKARQAANMAPTARIGLEAPGIIVPGKLNNVREAVRNMKGNYGARRVERAADEIPNLERMFQEDALKEAFTGDNARGLMTIDPADFEKYAHELSKRTSVGPEMAELAKQGDIDKYTVPTDEYIKYLQQIGGFSDVPYLNLFKDEVGLPNEAKVIGHEGRHRNRALANQGQPASLVQIQPRGDLREGMPRRTQEDFIEALKQELDAANRLVIPESEPYFRRPSIQLPDVYAEGGEVHMSLGGDLAKVAAKSAKTAKPAAKAAEKAAEYLPGVHYADPLKPPTMKFSEALGNAGAEGKKLNFTEADRSRVFGSNRGGVGFAGLQHYSEPHKEANTVWGFGNKTTAEKKIRQNDPENTIWTTFVGAPNQHKSNSVVLQDAFKEFNESLKSGKATPRKIELMNERLRSLTDKDTGLPVFDADFDITDPDAFGKLNSFARRGAVGDVFLGEGVKGPMRLKTSTEKWQDTANMEALLRRETDPDLIGAGTYDVGNRLFMLDNGIIERPDLNAAFPWQVTGTDLGMKYEPVPMTTAMRDWAKQYEGRKTKSGKPAPAGYMDLARNNPSQFVSDEYLTWLQKQGKKAGGLAQAKKPKKVARHGNTVPN